MTSPDVAAQVVEPLPACRYHLHLSNLVSGTAIFFVVWMRYYCLCGSRPNCEIIVWRILLLLNCSVPNSSFGKLYTWTLLFCEHGRVRLRLSCNICDIVACVCQQRHIIVICARHVCQTFPDILFSCWLAKMLRCPVCKIVFTDVAAALLRFCPSVKASDIYSVDCLWNKITSHIEKDEKQRAACAFPMHQN